MDAPPKGKTQMHLEYIHLGARSKHLQKVLERWARIRSELMLLFFVFLVCRTFRYDVLYSLTVTVVIRANQGLSGIHWHTNKLQINGLATKDFVITAL